MKKKRDGEHITLVLKISDKEKFRKFHGMVLEILEEGNSDEQIGASAVFSSWCDLTEERDNLERVCEYAIENLMFEEQEIADLMFNKGISQEEAEKLIEEEK